MYAPKKAVWQDEFKTGDDGLDFQHKYLIETFNKLGEVIEEGFGKENVQNILGRLKFYAEWHFDKEETVMAAVNCPVMETNKAEHKRFMEMVRDYEQKLARGGGSQALALEIHETLLNWLMNHVLTIDTRLRETAKRQ